MTALDQIADLLQRLPMDADGRAAADKLVADLRKEQGELVTAFHAALSHIKWQQHEGDLLSMNAETREKIDIALSRFPAPVTP